MQTTHVKNDELSRIAPLNTPNLPILVEDTDTADLIDLWRDLGGSD
jgi:hypothetical protein